MFTLNECTRKNLCVDCTNERCLRRSDLSQDCPRYRCLYEIGDERFEDCDRCTFMKEYASQMREEYRRQKEEGK